MVKRGEKIVDANKTAVDRGIDSLVKVNIPESWANAPDEEGPIKKEPDFVKKNSTSYGKT